MGVISIPAVPGSKVMMDTFCTPLILTSALTQLQGLSFRQPHNSQTERV